MYIEKPGSKIPSITIPIPVIVNFLLFLTIFISRMYIGVVVWGLWFLSGNFASVMFMKEIKDLNPIARPLVGLLYNWNLSENTQTFIIYTIAFLSIYLLAILAASIMATSQLILCRLFYGNPGITPTKILGAIFKNSLCALAFIGLYTDSAFHLPDSGIRNLLGLSPEENVVSVLSTMIIIFTVWLQHSMNKKMCNIE